MLTDERIEDIADANGHATVISYGRPAKREVIWYDGDLTPFARAIESAATAPLLARIAELEKWQAEHWTALEIINNYFVSKDLLLVVEDGGPDAAARNIVHSVVALERELEEARKALEAARNWIAERPDMRQCSAGKIVAELTRTLSANAAIKEQK